MCDPPCQHAGLCIRNSTCFCSKGYEGGLCQYDIGMFSLNASREAAAAILCLCICFAVSCEGGCWNGGECISVNSIVKCLCPFSWTGSKCQEATPHLFPAICPQGCRNGGSCVAPGICSCPEGWVGGACHKAICRHPCLNGGKCVAPNVCRCRGPYSGAQCKEKEVH
ncbi:VWDE protein, partial [Polyodon spathula]|nr:VWDE protein [Polyodon spathula]